MKIESFPRDDDSTPASVFADSPPPNVETELLAPTETLDIGSRGPLSSETAATVVPLIAPPLSLFLRGRRSPIFYSGRWRRSTWWPSIRRGSKSPAFRGCSRWWLPRLLPLRVFIALVSVRWIKVLLLLLPKLVVMWLVIPSQEHFIWSPDESTFTRDWSTFIVVLFDDMFAVFIHRELFFFLQFSWPRTQILVSSSVGSFLCGSTVY